MKFQLPNYAIWIIVAISSIIAFAAGYGAIKARKIGISLAAAFGGYLLGIILTATIVISNIYA